MKMEVTIEKLDHYGRGIAYSNDKIIFVEKALPGELVDIEIVNSKNKYDEAIIKNMKKESLIRVESICPYYKECGGCDLLHLPYDEQLKYKENKVKEILYKFAGVSSEKISKIIPSPNQFNYRNKVTLKSNGKVGYHKKRTNQVVNIDKCYLANNSINKMINDISKISLDKQIDEIILRDINGSNESLTLNLHEWDFDEKQYKEYLKISRNVNILYKNKLYKISGDGNIIGNLSDKKYKISPTAFFQVNTEQTVKLYEIIKSEIMKHNNPSVFDLYCGTGTIGIYISEYAKEVLGIEINESAIEDAKVNKLINNINNISFFAGDTKKILSKNRYYSDIVIVDPPRAGLDKEVINDLIRISPIKIIYVSCDPVTLARDLKLLQECYDVSEIIPIDMFPNTYHIENVAILIKK